MTTKWQIEVWLHSQENWLSFDKPFGTQDEAMHRMMAAKILSQDFKFRVVEVHF